MIISRRSEVKHSCLLLQPPGDWRTISCLKTTKLSVRSVTNIFISCSSQATTCGLARSSLWVLGEVS